MSSVLILFCTLLGLCVGSFLNVLIPRLHEDQEGILWGRSVCPHCKAVLKAHELIPILSYLLQKRRCRSCKTKISLWYPLVEFSGALSFGVLALHSEDPTHFFLWAGLLFVLLFTFFYDLRYKEIHDAILLPGILFAFLVSFLIGDPLASLWGALLGGAFFFFQWGLSRGKWVGSGDIRIGIFMGATLGLGSTAVALLLSYLLGSIISLILLATGWANRKSTLPLGPFLVVGTVLAFFYGQALLDWYLFQLL